MPKVIKQTATKAKPKPASGGSVIDRIGDIDDGLDGVGLKMLLYGGSGSGKTCLWGSFPKRILAIVASGSDKPGELRTIDTPAMRKVVKQVVLSKSEEIRELATYLAENPDEFKTIILDHATGLQDILIREMLGLTEAPVQYTWGLMTRDQWGQVGIQMKEYLRCLLNLSQDVVIIAQERSFGDDNESQLIAPTIGASLTPSATGWLNTAVDYIAQTFKRTKTERANIGTPEKPIWTLKPVGGVEFCLRVGPDAVYTTKFRKPKGIPLPDVIVDPDYDKILRVIKASQGK